MIERIRYTKVAESVYEANHPFSHPSNGAKYRVRINLIEPMWRVFDDVTELVALSGIQKNFNKAKLEVREALRSLGIEVSTGTRNRQKKQG